MMSRLLLPLMAVAGLAFGMLLLLIMPGRPARAGVAPPGPTTCRLRLMSGNGMVGGQDTLNEFSIDGGTTWQPSSLIISPLINPVGMQVWASPIAGTQWIVGDQNVYYNGPAKTIYRTIFTPSPASTSSTAFVTVSVHADNAVAIELNGQQIGAQTVGAIYANFQDPPDVFTSSAPLNPGSNELRFSVSNTDSVQGLDYLATIDYGCGTPAGSCITPPSGLQAWWPLNEIVGATSIADISGNNHNGTAQQMAVGPVGPPPRGPAPSTSPLVVPPAVVGGALYFYTNQTYAQVPNHTALEPGSGDFSIDGWVYPIQVGPGFVQPIVDKFDAALSTGYALFIESPSIANNARLTFAYGDGSLSLALQSISPMTYATWHHVGVTVQRTAAPPPGGHYLDVELYVDGLSQGTQFVGNPVGSIANNLALLIGGTRAGPMSGFGEIALDEIQVYNRALSPSDIAAIFYAGTPGKCTPTPTPTITPLRTTPAPSPTATPTHTSTPAPRVCGDVNDDESANPIDAQLILQFVSGLLHQLRDPASADVNGQGGINAIDAQLILQSAAGFDVHLPC